MTVGQIKNPLKMKTEQFPIAAAIVVFEKPKARDVCIFAHDQYAPAYTLNCAKKPPMEMLFRGYYPLNVTAAPEPASIYWENYRSTVIRKVIFGIILFCLLIGILFVSIVITAVLSEIFNSLEFSTYCPKQYLYAKDRNVITAQEK